MDIVLSHICVEGETVSLPSRLSKRLIQKFMLSLTTCLLLDDDQSVSIQMRGGPEPLMVTGWAQIMSLDPDYIGIYHCIATNTEGQVK